MNLNQLCTSLDHARQQVADGYAAPLVAEEIIKKAREVYAKRTKLN